LAAAKVRPGRTPNQVLSESSSNHNGHQGVISLTDVLCTIASGERPHPAPSLTSLRKATDMAVLILLEQSEELDRRIRVRRERDRRYRERKRQLAQLNQLDLPV
jgi:hypothetical protein